MTKSKVQLLQGPTEFFRSKVIKAADQQGLVLSKEVEFYLVNLLCHFIDPDRYFKLEGDIDLFDTPIALILKKALEAPPEKQLMIYKTLGDISLYMSGYFQDYFNNKTFDIQYFSSIGSQAYASVATRVQGKHKNNDFYDLYQNLSLNFDHIVEVFAIISDSTITSSSSVNLLAVYDRWTKVNSERLRKKLEKSGIVPVSSLSKQKQ